MEIQKHEFVPKHEVISEKEEKELLEQYGIEKFQLPKILGKDPAIKELKLKRGTVVRITRESSTAGTALYYRVVI